MQKVEIDDLASAEEFAQYLIEDAPQYTIENGRILTKDYDALVPENLLKVITAKLPKKTVSEYHNDLIYGKDKTEGILSIEVKDDQIFLFLKSGEIIQKPMVYWILAPQPFDKHFYKLEGNLHYKWMRIFRSKQDYYAVCNRYKDQDLYRVWNDVEMAQLYYGFTLFKGTKLEDISVLSFDIESAGLVKNADSEVYLITNTLYKNGELIRKHFRLDHYNNSGEMIDEWCAWVVQNDPLIINGHNIYGYDLPYLSHVAALQDRVLKLGKYEEPIHYAKNTSKFRVDGNQDWEYHKANIYGRHIVDGMFLAVRYGVGKGYESWGLKTLAEAEGFVKSDRQFYDASKIAKNWPIPEERAKIVAYGLDDADDSYNLYKLMIPAIFYMTQSVPKSFTTMTTSASGSQLNSILVRGYLQEGHSIPKADEPIPVGGGISFAIPGVHRNCLKVDIISMYPSIIRSLRLHSKSKDPKGKFLEMVDYFTEQRLENKKMFKKTGEKYYDDLQSSQKISINSAYGTCGSPGLNFNDYNIANLITKTGRNILKKSILWATGRDIKQWWPEYDEEKDK